ncbi:MAG: nuclear transport factor 2 family protein [Pseudomonadota bacterium]
MEAPPVAQALHSMYEARLAADVEACVASFAEAGVYRMANVYDASGQPLRARGHEQLRAALAELVNTWRWVRRDERSLVVEGDRACALYRLQLVHRPTGEAIDTEMMDHVTFDGDGKATTFAQFLDTALVARLST